jgi:hypothetical protein
VPELRRGGELLLGDAQPALDRVGVVRPAADQPVAQVLARRRLDEDLDRAGQRVADLPGALELDLEDDGPTARRVALELLAQRPVAVAGVLGPLDELAGGDPPVELLLGEEPVVLALSLARPRVARGRRDAQRQLGDPLAQQPDQRALADAGGPGDDEDARQEI